MDDLSGMSDEDRGELRRDVNSFPAPGVVYGASKLSLMLMLTKERLIATQVELSKSYERPNAESMRIAELEGELASLRASRPEQLDTELVDAVAGRLTQLLPQLSPRLLELIEAHVAPKHDDASFTPALDAEVLQERIRCARIVADSVSPKRLELILSGEDIDSPSFVTIPSGGISG
jgi:hypothetical protein